jgi:hypothetical protein
MFELAVATFGASQVPAVIFEQPNEVSHFHARIILALSDRWKPRQLKSSRFMVSDDLTISKAANAALRSFNVVREAGWFGNRQPVL